MSSDFNLAEFAAYDEEEEDAAQPTAAQDKKEEEKDAFRSVHAAGFREFLLKPELLRAISDAGFEHPSAVQAQCIPQAILGTDVICQAKSGMGKTAVFVVAVLQQIVPVDGEVSTLIMCHTRELAYQIFHEFGRFKKYMPDVKVEVFYGGIPVKTHKDILKNNTPHIVIGTPGRTKQLVKDGDLKLDSIKYFILDECDKMLEATDMRADVQQIYRQTPHDKQVLMFTATLSEEIKVVAKKFMHNPLEVYVNQSSKLTLHGLQQYYVQLQESEKNRKLVDLLDNLDFNQVVIFMRTVSRANELNRLLKDCNFPSTVIHSRLRQEDRIQRYKDFKDFKTRIIVATNIFGRGIDVERVNLVINYDMPTEGEDKNERGADTYLHRVGRAGRFGTKGLAISFVSSEEDGKVLNAVQERFTVNIEPLPEGGVDSSTYMTAANTTTTAPAAATPDAPAAVAE